jgi:hypothetical protein
MPRRTRRPAQFHPLESRRLLTAYLVNTLADTTDAADNLTTLREAVTQANASAGPDTIAFAPALTGAIKLDPGQGQLGITDALTLTGPGAPVLSIDAQNASRIFDIAPAVTAAISNLTLTNGRAPIQQDGGGIRNAGTLTLAGVVLSHNVGGDGGTSVSTLGPAGGNGGAIDNAGTLTVRDSAILDNAAGRGADGLDAFDFGGLGGRGGDGGAIYNEDGATLTLLNSTLARNKAGDGGDGGNVSPFFGGEGGRGGNGGSGGGVANAGAATLVNVTLTANASGNGGFGGTGATFGRPGFYGDGGGLYNDGTSFKVGNTLAAKNDPGAATPDASGAFSSLGHNLIAVADGSTGWLASDKTGTDFQPVDAKLGDVNYHGGPTPTVAVLAGSPAIDSGDAALADANALATDQRGYVRKYAAAIDVGALEFNSALAGDANRDDRVNFNDLLALARNYNQSGKTWSDGDFNGDGTVNFSDLLTLARNYNQAIVSPPPTPAAPVVTQNPVLASTTTSAPTFSTRKIAKPTPAARAKR